jgi:hypothetical protein
MRHLLQRLLRAALVSVVVTLQPVSIAHAQIPQPAVNPDAPTYADLVALADSADMVLRAQVRSMARVENQRAPGLKAGKGRFYVKAKTRALLSGSRGVSDSLAYLVDLPLDSRGKPPALKKQDVLIFARPVAGSVDMLQLVAPDAQILWSDRDEAMLRTILRDLLSPDAPPVVTGVREIIHVPGNLAGAGETQIFLSTRGGSAASITVHHEPGRQPVWGVSFSELIADVTRSPRPETLEWYRLACFLPNTLPPAANLSEAPASRQQALSDYRMVLGQLGECRSNRR